MYPMKLVPVYKDYLWGGNELKKMYEEIFKLPMSGKLVQEGEVQNV